MKKIVGIICCFLWLAVSGSAQNLTKLGVSTVKVKDFGTIMLDEQVKGYYYLYLTDSKNQKNNYLFSVLDENLREVNSIDISRPSDSYVMNIAFNGKSFAFLFFNRQSRSLELISYSKDLVYQASVRREQASSSEWFVFSEQELLDMYHGDFKDKWLVPIKDSGFALYLYAGRNATSTYKLECLDNNLNLIWINEGLREKKMNSSLENVFQDSKYIGSLTHTVPMALGKLKKDNQTSNREEILIHDIKSGELVSTIALYDETYLLKAVKVIYDSTTHKVEVFGEYYEKQVYFYTSHCLGLFRLSFDITRKVLQKEFLSWLEGLSRYYKLDEKGKNIVGTSFLIHDIIKSKDGNLLLVAEEYRYNLLNEQLNTYDMIIFQFDNEFKIKQMHRIAKKQAEEKKPMSLANIYAIREKASELRKYGYFDYEFSNSDVKKQLFSVAYKEISEGKDKKRSYNLVTFANDTLSATDKIEVRNAQSKIFINKAKSGYVMVMEYFEKDKKMDMRLEKINY